MKCPSKTFLPFCHCGWHKETFSFFNFNFNEISFVKNKIFVKPKVLWYKTKTLTKILLKRSIKSAGTFLFSLGFLMLLIKSESKICNFSGAFVYCP